MTLSSEFDLIEAAMSTSGEMPAEFDDTVDRQAAVSTALGHDLIKGIPESAKE